eukprot:gene10505-10665_t
MALQQGQLKGTVAQLEGALSFSEKKVKDQLLTIEQLQAQLSSLTAELQQARGAAAMTPDRCRTAAQALQAEADRAATHALNTEAQVKKLKQIVQVETRSQASEAEANAANAMAAAAALEQQLAATSEQLLSSQSRVADVEELLAAASGELSASADRAALLVAERDAAARNLLRAEAELSDVSECSTKMFRQVRFISHMLEKNNALVGKLPDFASLARDLKVFVAANARNWERKTTDDRTGSAAGGGALSNHRALDRSIVADTAASGLRDVISKA